jgi:ribonuclease BN (tRNA processing enzyme)
MGATWTVLGAGSILPRAGYGCSGYALQPEDGAKVTLFDCGPGTIRSLAGVGLGIEDVERVVISHFHIDHCLDLFALAFARRNPRFDPLPPLEIVGPYGLRALLERGENTLGGQAREPGAEVSEVESGKGVQRGGARLTCVRTGHTRESLAWRAELASGESVAYTGDTPESDAVAALARDVDLFVVECSAPDEQPIPNHLTPSSAGRMAAASGCRRLLLTHFYPELEPERARRTVAQTFTGPVELARDGSRHPLRP